MRRRIVHLISALGIALVAFATPASALAETWKPFFGPILNCTGYFSISTTQEKTEYVKDDSGKTSLKVVTSSFMYTPVSPETIGTGADGQPLVPCRSLCDVFVLVNNLMKFAVTAIVLIIIPVMIILGGFYLMTSGGNPGKRTKGKDVIVSALIGLAITVTAGLIVNQAMNIIFAKAWGDAIKQQIQDQIGRGVNLGFEASKVLDGNGNLVFQWNSLSCRALEGASTKTK